VKVDAPEGRAVLNDRSLVAVSLHTTLASELGVIPRLNPFGDLYGLLSGVVVCPTPIATAFISDSEVGTGNGLGGFLGFSHRHTVFISL
jgi:hypothetical protein